MENSAQDDFTGMMSRLERARAIAHAQNNFMAALSHELRRPLSPIVTALELLRLRGMMSQEQRIIERQVDHLRRLVDDLIDVSRIRSGKVRLDRRLVELGEVLTDAIEVSRPILDRRQHRIDIDTPQRGIPLYVDLDRMVQVFSNLLNNAAQYSDPGSRITIRTRPVGDDLIEIRIIDEGQGIAREQLEDIFDRFTRHDTPHSGSAGLGLGLSIVRNLVEMHGGTIAAQSEGIGRGSCFTVMLSVARGISKDPVRSPVPSKTQAEVRRVLVVDDDEDTASTLKDLLQCIGHEVEVAHDGPDALARARPFRPEVAIIDIGLPHMSGHELGGRLREQATADNPIRLVALSGFGRETDQRRSLDAGFEAHLVKPVELDDLRRALSGPSPGRTLPT